MLCIAEMALPPTKPPRGVKSPRETSGLLMSVIRTLSASESNEQRDREKAKLEKEYKRSDQKLDELVLLHDQDLTQVMQLFGKLSSRVTASREKIHAVKENLHACKMLLRCKRDELKKLWLEGVEHKHVLQLLEEIDHLREVPGQLEVYLARKHYLHATQLLVSALTLGDGSLEGVDALREVRSDLQAKKQQLHVKLMEELTCHLYVRSTQEVLALQRQGSGRDNLLTSPFQRATELRGSSRTPKARRALLDVSSSASPRPGMNSLGSDQMDSIQEDVDAVDPEASSEHFMAILVECLALLNKIPDAVEMLKVEMQTELLAIIARTTQQILDSSAMPPQPHGQAASKPVLPELMHVIFSQFRQVAAAHQSVLRSLAQAADKYRVDVRLYEMPDVWSKMQAVLQLLLTDYLDIQNMAGESQQTPASFSEPTSDISMFFVRRKIQRQKKTPLFRFDYSSHALSINNYLKEQQKDAANKVWITECVLLAQKEPESAVRPQRQKLLVCQPDPRNIMLVFIPLMEFVGEIERATGCAPATPCTLSAFVADYVKEVFLGRHHALVAASIEAATKSADAWRATTGPEVMRDLGVTRPLLQETDSLSVLLRYFLPRKTGVHLEQMLQECTIVFSQHQKHICGELGFLATTDMSTVKVESCIQDLRQLMQALPAYAEHFLSIICSILRNYRETCQAAYRGIVQPDSEDKRVCSAAWLKDEDISRFIKSLPNWADLQAHKAAAHRRRWPLRREETTEEESPEDVRQRNIKEAEILASNLGEGGVNAHEILSDVCQLKGLAQLQESMEWFSMSLLKFAMELPGAGSSASPGPNVVVTPESVPLMPESAVDGLFQLAQEFEELANTCLLVLHLEVRVQCFHYLLPRPDSYNRFVGGGGLSSQEPDPRVLELSRVLVVIDEAMNSSLQVRKSKYIFEGLGHLIAKILITSAQFMDRIDEAGIQKMCRNVFALQQTLTNITMSREVALDYARHYYELFFLTPEEILSAVMEKGPEFSELEYMNAFQLLHRSQPEPDPAAVNAHLGRLSDILGEVGVTV